MTNSKRHHRKQDENPVSDLLIARDPTFRKVYHEDTALPQVQEWTKETLDPAGSDYRYCPSCAGFLVRFPDRYNCNSCGQGFMKSDNVLSNPKQDLAPGDAQLDNADAFFTSFGPEDHNPDSSPYVVEWSSSDQRVQIIRMKNGVSPTEYNIRSE